MASDLPLRTSSATKSSQALRRPSLEPKWWMTSAALTPAASAMARQPHTEAVLPELLDGRIADSSSRRQIG